MSENIPDKLPQAPTSNPESKPNGFQRLMKGIGNGMESVGKGLYTVVKEVAKIPVVLVKGADSLVSHIPIAGEVYGAGKEVIRGVWGIGESLPIMGSVLGVVRGGVTEVAGSIGFTPEDDKRILDRQMEFLLGQKKDFIDRGKIEEILKKNPELQSHFDEYFKNIEAMKTEKEIMSIADLIQDGENLKKQISEELSKGKEEKKGDVFQNEYLDFKRTFPSLPEYSTLQKDSKQYSLLQNMYFGRKPTKPSLEDPIVKEFMQKSLDYSLNPNSETFKVKQAFALQNATAIADGFAMSHLERIVMEREINRIEKRNRMPPTMSHEFSGDDYGLQANYVNANKILFSDNSDAIDASLASYRGVLLNIFQGGGH